MAIAVALTGPLYLWVARASDCRRVSVGARWWRFSPLIALVLVGAPVSASVALAQDVLPIDDAYHYRFFANGRHDGNYVEWWYFNFFDARQGVQAIFTYFIADPEDLSGRGLAQLVSVAYTSQGIVGGVGVYSPDSFSASYAQADVQIDANAIQVIDRDTYRVVGASRDGRLSWDLIYVRDAASWFAADRLKVGRLAWERMSWLIYMPGAEVSGWLVVDGQVYAIAARGYHDHNWGEWVFPNALWNWAQYSEPGLSFEMGDFINQPVGVAGVEFQGDRTVFTKEQYQLTHTRWAFDVENRRRYPTETRLRADNGTRRLGNQNAPAPGPLALPAARCDHLRTDGAVRGAAVGKERRRRVGVVGFVWRRRVQGIRSPNIRDQRPLIWAIMGAPAPAPAPSCRPNRCRRVGVRTCSRARDGTRPG